MTEPRTRTRMRVLAALTVFMFAALTTRLWFLQVLASDQFATQAQDNQVRLVPIEPLRGQILDRTGKVVLVGNRPSTEILVDRVAMAGEQEQVLYRLSNLLHMGVQDIVDRLNSQKYLPYQPVPIAEDAPKDAVFYISEHPDLFPGVSYGLAAVRDYPQGDLAAHILGYVGEISSNQLAEPQFKRYSPGEVVGKAGVESTYERWLHGRKGYRELQVNAQGKVLNENFGARDPVQGNNVVLSIDARVQRLAEGSLAAGLDLAHHLIDRTSGKPLAATGGAVIVMDPRNGQVLALASNPTYDPAIFQNGLNFPESTSLDLCFPGHACPKPKHNLPLLDRAIQGLYPAGSTFKPFIAASALKEGYATPGGHYNCPSGYIVPGDPSNHVFHNWDPVSIGFISLAEALTISCDTVFYQLGYRFWVHWHRTGGTQGGDELLQKDLSAFGFGRHTGVDLPNEFGGLVPTNDYERKVYAANPKVYGRFNGWLPGDSLNLSIGQGFLYVTPIQLAVGYSAIANGGTLYAPRVAWKVEQPDGTMVKTIPPQVTGHLPLSRRLITYVRNALTGVPRTGTASAAFSGFPLDRIPVAGKTGTADVFGRQPYSWFAAMAPANKPRYVVVCLVEQGGHGATTAAPVVRRILEGLFGIPASGPLRAGTVVD